MFYKKENAAIYSMNKFLQYFFLNSHVNSKQILTLYTYIAYKSELYMWLANISHTQPQTHPSRLPTVPFSVK